MSTLGSEAFWSHFVKHHWGRKPAVFKNVLDRPVLSPAEMFELVRLNADHLRAGSRKVMLRFYGDAYNAQVLEDFERYLPVAGERGFDGYRRRLKRQLGTDEWGMALNNLQATSPKVWSFGRELAHSLFSRIGLPGGRISAESFVGPYRSTPFGVHKDKFHVFTLPVVGEKTTLLWPYAQLAPQLGLSEREDDRQRIVMTPFRARVPGTATPIVLRARVGDMTYWPPPYWHVGQGQGDFSATIIFAISETSTPNEWLTKIIGELPTRMAPVGPSGRRSAARHARKAIGAIAAHGRHLQSERFAQTLRAEMERRASALSFDPPVEPIVPAPQLTVRSMIESDRRFPILTRENGESLDCFINGYVLNVAPPKAMRRLVKRLNRGGLFCAGELCELTRGWLADEGCEGDSEPILAFLSSCATYRAVREK